MATVIGEIGPLRYCATCNNGGSIIPHIRHCLDHLQALASFLTGDQTRIDYENRRRGWCGETEPQPAVDELTQLANVFAKYDGPCHCETAVTVHHIVDPDRPPAQDTSTLSREVHFCLSHSVHHQALIALLAQSLGAEIAADFGYAPSTIASLRR